jgi:hypothetical protein
MQRSSPSRSTAGEDLIDREFSSWQAGSALARQPLVVDYDDPEFTGAGEGSAPSIRTLVAGAPDYAWDPATNGTRSRSTTRRARPATRRVSSIITAARIC